MHTVFALLCFVVVIHGLIFPYPSGLLHWHCGNLEIAPVPAKQPWWIWINTSCEFIMNDCITTTKQSTTKPCAYFLGYTVMTSFKIAEEIGENSVALLSIEAYNLDGMQTVWAYINIPLRLDFINLQIQEPTSYHQAYHHIVQVEHIEAETKWPPFHRPHFQMHFLELNFWILIQISLRFIPKGPINNIPSLVQIMAWRRSGDKPLSQPMMNICITQPQWVNSLAPRKRGCNHLRVLH